MADAEKPLQPATEPQSVTRWLPFLRAGSSEAVTQLWERYFARLVALAQSSLLARDRKVADGEDAALAAIRSFCSAVGKGRFSELHDREGLWRLLATFTMKKVEKQRRAERRAKRGDGRAVEFSALAGPDQAGDGLDLDLAADDEPTPEEAALFADEVRSRLAALESDRHRAIALLRMEGYEIAEIGERLGMSRAGVNRRLGEIRDTWLSGQ